MEHEDNDNILPSELSLLPLELESNILSRLPIKPLLRCKCVCKRWRDEINHPDFIKSHTIISQTRKGNSGYDGSLILIFWCSTGVMLLLSTDFHSSCSKGLLKVSRHRDFPKHDLMIENLVGCCNGLLLFMEIKRNYNLPEKRLIFSFYNPTTSKRNILTLPQIPPEHKECISFIRAGFGYDSTSDDYKILCLYIADDLELVSYVYSMKSNSWKIIQGPPNCPLFSDSTKIVFSNNALHWVAWKSSRGPKTKYIICFDLVIEEYHEVALPEDDESRDDIGQIEWELVDLRGCLHLVKVKYDRTCQVVKMWAMKGYGSKQPSLLWAILIDDYMSLARLVVKNERSLSFAYYNAPMPCAYSEDGHELLISPGFDVPTFTRYDLQSGELKAVEIGGLPDHLKCVVRYQVMPWTGSLVQL